MSNVNGIYVPKHQWQPVCVGMDENGELIWKHQTKEPWHLKMFPVTYGGDFSEQWMWKTLQEKGFEWDSKAYIEQKFACKSRKLLSKIKTNRGGK